MPVKRGQRTQDRRWRRLILRYQAGDRAAGDELVRDLMPYVRSLARRYGKGGDRDDLVQSGLLGLTKAMAAYRAGGGSSVGGYLLPCVAGEMRRHLRDTGWAVHVPRPLQESAMRVTSGVNALTARLGRAPTVPELAAEVGLSEEAVIEGLEAGQAYRAGSLDAPAPGDGGTDGALADRLGRDDAGLEWAEGRALLRQARRRLDRRERLVLSLRFDEDMTQAEIAQLVGCSQMQISRVLRGALEKVRDEAAIAA